MIVSVRQGNILELPADVLITPANPWLTMSTGINADIVGRCGMRIQEELNAYLEECGLKAVPGGTVVPTQAIGLPFKHLIHAVAVDAFEDSSSTMVARTLVSAFRLVEAFAVDSVSIPPLATGYGPLTLKSFIQALGEALDENSSFAERVFLVLEEQEEVAKAKSLLEEIEFRSTVDVR